MIYEITGFDGNSPEGILKEFSAPASALDGATVLYAKYECECYEGQAEVIYEKDGELFEVSGSHCSCYGLENQWEPMRIVVGALRMRPQWRELASDLIDEIEAYMGKIQSSGCNPQ